VAPGQPVTARLHLPDHQRLAHRLRSIWLTRIVVQMILGLPAFFSHQEQLWPDFPLSYINCIRQRRLEHLIYAGEDIYSELSSTAAAGLRQRRLRTKFIILFVDQPDKSRPARAGALLLPIYLVVVDQLHLLDLGIE